MKRNPAVAGTFYPANPSTLERFVKEFSVPEKEIIKAIGVVSPHAGYIYSGSVAGRVYAHIRIPETVIVIGPNHTGYGSKAGIIPEGSFSMPGFNMEIDQELATAIMKNSNIIEDDADSHVYEHSLEVQLPFIHYHNPSAKLVPICVMGRGYDFVSSIGNAIARAIKESGKNVLIVASSDMTHYEPDAVTRKKDRLAIDMILNLDPQGLIRITNEKDISMCGVIPAGIMLVAAKQLGAQKAKLVDYKTSGEVTNDYDEVVGYAGIIVY
ncbi:MAG: AmmeMemoRadiSam system protein B [bacterium]